MDTEYAKVYIETASGGYRYVAESFYGGLTEEHVGITYEEWDDVKREFVPRGEPIEGNIDTLLKLLTKLKKVMEA